jgi:hypothetical protein
VDDDLGSVLAKLQRDVQYLLATMQQLTLNLEAARKGKRQTEAEALRLVMVLNQVKTELEDDAHWITDLANNRLAVELSPRTRQAVARVLAETPLAAQQVAYLGALESLAEQAADLVDAEYTAHPDMLDALREAVKFWRSLAL